MTAFHVAAHPPALRGGGVACKPRAVPKSPTVAPGRRLDVDAVRGEEPEELLGADRVDDHDRWSGRVSLRLR
jgi:hypothetical protein